MQRNCGECERPFSALCEQQFDCSIHRAKCFGCRPCKAGKMSEQCNLASCQLCSRICPREQLYYEFRCDKYMCRFHFLNEREYIMKKEIQLPCGCLEMAEQVQIYMHSFCLFCGRKCLKKDSLDISICLPCEKEPIYLYSAQEKKKLEPEIFVEKVVQKVVEKTVQKIKQPEEQNVQSIDEMLLQKQNQISILKSQIHLLKQNLVVSQFSRTEIKKSICHTERDQSCLICYIQFNLTNRKPFMVCLQQHLVCQPCLQTQAALSNCPLCRDTIQRTKLLPCRERIKTLELQSIINQKYSDKVKKYLDLPPTEPEPQKKFAEQQVQTIVQQDRNHLQKPQNIQQLPTECIKGTQALQNNSQSKKRGKTQAPLIGRKKLKR